jgi:peroxiredoxin
LQEYKELGVSIIAGSVDSAEETAEVARDLSFPVAYGMTRKEGDAIGAWWEERRDHIQPSEFVITGKGRVMASTYSSSPVGRMDPAETLVLVNFIANARKNR